MINIPPILPPAYEVKKIHISEKDPHHEQNKKKHEEEPEDEVILSRDEDKEGEHEPKRRQDNPLKGNIDIEA